MFLTVLENLQYCEKKGCIFIPDWTNTSYTDKAYGYNAWDYYFEPISGHTLEDVERGNNRLIRVAWNRSQFEMKPLKINGKSLTKIEAYNYYIKKYIKVRNGITGKIDSFYDTKMKGCNVLGAHIR